MEWPGRVDAGSLLLPTAPVPLLPRAVEYALLPLVMLFSATGMMLLKWAQLRSNAGALAVGYLLEGTAFAVYPFTLRVHSLRFVSAAWASSSIFASVAGGAIWYAEVPSWVSLCGCGLLVMGVVLTAM